MTPFYFIVTSLPFALYFLALAWLHGRRRPTLISGRRDVVALALATFGALFVGPLQILPGLSAWIVWRANVWSLVALLYLLVLMAVLSRLRPRFVVYNVTLETLRKTISTTALELDSDARWSGDAMNMPGLGVQFYLDDSPLGKVVSLVAIGREISSSGWKRLRDALDVELRSAEPPKRRVCYALLFAGVALLTADFWCFVQYYDQICDAIAFYLSV